MSESQSVTGKAWQGCEHQSVKTIPRTLLTLTSVGRVALGQQSFGRAGELIYFQYSDGQSAFGPSLLWPATGANSEIADEFDLVRTSTAFTPVASLAWGR